MKDIYSSSNPPELKPEEYFLPNGRFNPRLKGAKRAPSSRQAAQAQQVLEAGRHDAPSLGFEQVRHKRNGEL